MLVYKNKVTRANTKNRPTFGDWLPLIGYVEFIESMNSPYLVGSIQPVHQSDSSQIFWFFRARSIYRKIWMERKLLSIDRTTKWLTSSMTHSVEFIFSCVSRGMNKKVWSSGTVYQVHRDPHTKTDPIGTTGTESPETRWTGRPTMSRESQVETNAISFTNDL